MTLQISYYILIGDIHHLPPLVGVPLIPFVKVIDKQNQEYPISNFVVNYTWKQSGGPVYSGLIYVPDGGNVGFPLNFEVKLFQNGVQCASLATSTKTVIMQQLFNPLPRHFLSAPGSIPKSHKLTVLTYNVLADHAFETKLGTPMYPSAVPLYNWVYRLNLVCKEVISYQPDVVCFQEGEVHQFKAYVETKLDGYVFHYIMKKRVWDRVVGPDTQDGCIIAVKKGVFEEVLFDEIDFVDEMKNNNSPNVMTQLRHADCIHEGVSNILKLKWHDYEKQIYIANVHLSARSLPSRIVQAYYLGKKLDVLAKSTDGVIICGDFNSFPIQRDIYCQMRSNSINLPQDLYQIFKKRPLGFLRGRHMDSAYRKLYLQQSSKKARMAMKINEQTLEPKFTRYNPYRDETLDYILYDGKVLECFEVLSLFNKVQMPSATIPSDHVALAAKFYV